MLNADDRSGTQAHVYLIGDATFDFVPGLQRLLYRSHKPLLQAFFGSVYRVLRSEIAKTASVQRVQFPRFTSVQDLLTLQRHDGLHPALHNALICTFQLASFISGQDDVYSHGSDVYLVGICTGAIAAAAISSSRNASDLLDVAPHSVGVAFRTAFRACEVGDSIERTTDLGSWLITVMGLSPASKVVEEFCHERHIPIASRPYVSFIAEHAVSISGPPSILRTLKYSKLSQYRVLESRLRAPYHAAHLFGKQDVEAILETTAETAFSRYKCHIPVVSCATGALVPAWDYTTQLRAAVEDILLNPIAWNDLVDGFAYFSRFLPKRILYLHPMGTADTSAMRHALQKRGLSAEISTPNSSPSPLDPGNDAQISDGDDRLPRSNVGVSGKAKIAIVGMSGRFPEAENLEDFWDILFKGLDVHKVVPPSRWNASTHVDETGKRKNTSRTPFGCWLKDPGAFDAKFFSMTPREAPQVDPASRLALMTAYEAMEKAGMVPGATPSTQKDRVGVFYGVTSNDWMEVNSAQNIDTFFIPGGNRAFIPGRINYFFKFSGPSYSIDTACSSSLSATHTACNSLWQGDIDTAIVGGTNVLTNPDFTAGLDRGHFLSRTGNCKSFDNEADGYCRAEGICTVILKRLDDAVAESDPILAVILGAYTNHSAEADSITRPLADAQKSIFEKILNDTGVDPLDVSYVEMHGTGTQAGDRVEMESVVDSFAPSLGPRSRADDHPLYVGTVKANTGHSEAAAGVTSLVKVLLMMQNNTIPPHAGIKTTLNKHFPKDLDERNIRIARKPLSWRRQKGGSGRKAMINNFSAAGGNSCLLVEDAPPRAFLREDDTRSSHLIAVSAKSATSLKHNVELLLSYLSQDSLNNFSLSALSYTTTARRTHYPHRVAVRGSDITEVKAQFQLALKRGAGSTRARSAPKVIFAFTGNGSQYAGMGKQLYENFPTFRSDINRFDQLAQKQGFQSVLPLYSSSEGPIDQFDPLIVQVGTVCLEIALARLWISWGIVPSSVVGHSLGEYAALNVAGVLSESDAIYLTGRRAQLLQEKCQRGTHAMLAVRASTTALETSVSGRKCNVACINGREDTVLSGTVEELRQVQASLRQQEVKSSLLKVPYAFHSSQVDSVLEDLENVAQGVTFQKPRIPVICPLTSAVVDDVGSFSPQYLRRHCREPVNMFSALQHARGIGVINDKSIFVEIGPQPVLCNIVNSIFDSAITALPSLKRNEDTWVLFTSALAALYLAGSDINWREYHAPFRACHRVLQLPAYSWDLKNYWIQYVHDWSLRKGDPLPTVRETRTLPSSISKSTVPALESTSIHKVIEDRITDQKCFIIVETDLSRPDLTSLAQGHKVDNIPLTTPSVYAEIALRIAKHITDKYQVQLKGSIIDVSEMTIKRALVAHGGPGPQILRTSVEFSMEDFTAICHFTTTDRKTQKPGLHSHCKLRFHDRERAYRELQDYVYPAQSRMTELRRDVECGKSYRFSKSMIYRMVGSLAQFDSDYRQVNEIILDSEAMDALSVVNFSNLKQGGTFHTNPAAIDALTQSAGFTMNGNEHADLEKEVFVNHGWSSFQLFAELSSTTRYETHVKMQENPGKLWKGDVLVLDGGNIVAWIGGVTLQGVPRRVLKFILSKESTASAPSNASEGTAEKVRTQINAGAMDTVRGRQAPVCTVASVATTVPTIVTKVQHPSFSQRLQDVLRVVSEESGIPLTELADHSELSDLGIDSLLTLQITSRLQEEMNIDLEQSAFGHILTIKQLKEFVERNFSKATGMTPHTRHLDIEHVSSKLNVEAEESVQRLDCEHGGDLVTKALHIISEESGIPLDDLAGAFADIGVDSLLSLMIVDRFREELALDISSDISLLTEYPSIESLKLFLASSAADTEPPSSSTASSAQESTGGTTASTVTSVTSINNDKPLVSSTVYDTPSPTRPATSVILQGRPRVDPHTLILFPDGSGCAASYAQLSPVRPGLAVLGLNCPYYRNPKEMDSTTIDELMDSYLAEVRRRQPAGPYRLGGWSSGGILAFHAAQVLIQEGEQVDALVLLDTPPPTGLDPLPARWYEHCERANIFGKMMPCSAGAGGVEATKMRPPTNLIPHFRATIKVLQSYHADPLPEGLTPRTSIVWAGRCVFDGRPGRPRFETRPEDPKGIRFLTEPRQDFSAGAWARLFPGSEPTVMVMKEEDHFSMMQHGNGDRLARFLAEATA